MKNAEAAISCQKGGVNSLRTGGWGGNFRTGKLPIFLFFFFWGGGRGTSFFWGNQHPVTCHVSVLLQFYISIQKVLGQLWRYFPFLKLCKCSCMLHPLPTVASTPIRTKTNHHWLYHLQVLHTQ